MTTFALGSSAFKKAGRKTPSMDKTREMLNQYQAADAKLDRECKQKGVEKPQLIAKN